MPRLFVPENLAQVPLVDHLTADRAGIEVVFLGGRSLPWHFPGMGGPRSDSFVMPQELADEVGVLAPCRREAVAGLSGISQR